MKHSPDPRKSNHRIAGLCVVIISTCCIYSRRTWNGKWGSETHISAVSGHYLSIKTSFASTSGPGSRMRWISVPWWIFSIVACKVGSLTSVEPCDRRRSSWAEDFKRLGNLWQVSLWGAVAKMLAVAPANISALSTLQNTTSQLQP